MRLVHRAASAPPGGFMETGSANNNNHLHPGSKSASERTMNTAGSTLEETSSTSSSSASVSSDGFESPRKQQKRKGSFRQRMLHLLLKRTNSSRSESGKGDKQVAAAAASASKILFRQEKEDKFIFTFGDDPSTLSTSTGHATVIISNTGHGCKKAAGTMNKNTRCLDTENVLQERTLKETPSKAINVFQHEQNKSFSILDDEAGNDKPTRKQILLWERAKRNFKESQKDIYPDQRLSNVLRHRKSHHKNGLSAATTHVTPIYYALPKLSVLKGIVKRKQFHSDCMSTEARELLAALEAHGDLDSMTNLIRQLFNMEPSSSSCTLQEDAKKQCMSSADLSYVKTSPPQRRVPVDPPAGQATEQSDSDDASNDDYQSSHLARLLDAVDKQVAQLTAGAALSIDSDEWVDDRITI